MRLIYSSVELSRGAWAQMTPPAPRGHLMVSQDVIVNINCQVRSHYSVVI